MSSYYSIDNPYPYGRKSRRYDEFFNSRIIHYKKQEHLEDIEYTNDVYWNMFDFIALKRVRITKSSKDVNNKKYMCRTHLEVV